MDGSPYTPGAGHRPPVLAGREEFLRAWRTGLNDVAATGRQRAPDMILTAPRGVGKTATVLAFQDLCQEQGYEVVRLQAAAGNASLIDSLLRRARARAEEGAGPWARSRRAFERIAALNVSIGGFGAGISTREAHSDRPNRPGPEDVADALATLAREVRKDKPGAGVMIAIDEIQAAAPSDLTLIAAALHTLNTEYPDAPVMCAASGLPNTFDVLKDAGVTHPDRLFRFRPVSLLLEPADARFAIVEAARQRDVAWEPAAADAIVEVSSGYPAHLQVFADETWMAAKGPQVITEADAHAGIAAAAEVLERESLGPRFDAMTPREREFLAAIAVNGGRVSTADLAITLARRRSQSPTCATRSCAMATCMSRTAASWRSRCPSSARTSSPATNRHAQAAQRACCRWRSAAQRASPAPQPPPAARRSATPPRGLARARCAGRPWQPAAAHHARAAAARTRDRPVTTH